MDRLCCEHSLTSPRGENIILKGEMEMKVEVSCNGVVSPNPGFGGWGAVFEYEDGAKRLASGSEDNMTKAQMELWAVLKGLQELEVGHEVVIKTDSRVAFLYLTNEASARDPLLTAIRDEIRDVVKEKGHEVTVLSADGKGTAEARKLARGALDKILASPRPMFAETRNLVWELYHRRADEELRAYQQRH